MTKRKKGWRIYVSWWDVVYSMTEHQWRRWLIARAKGMDGSLIEDFGPRKLAELQAIEYDRDGFPIHKEGKKKNA